MKEKILKYLLQFDEIVYNVYESTFGKIYIFGDELSLKAITFNRAYINDYCLKKLLSYGTTNVINNGLSYLDHYFKRNSSAVDNFTITLQSGNIEYPKKDKKIVNGKNIRLDIKPFTENEISVYLKLLQLPYGKTTTYKELAENNGFYRGARFIGNTMAKNIFPILIPCHRVKKSDGTIGHYSGGDYRKKILLKHEIGV